MAVKAKTSATDAEQVKPKQHRSAHVVKAAARGAGGQASGFMKFVREQGVVGLAVGLAIGAEASGLVKVIVSSIITPILDLMVGKGGLENLKWTLNIADRTGVFAFGTLIDALIRFLAVAFVIYFIVKNLKLDKLDKAKDS